MYFNCHNKISLLLVLFLLLPCSKLFGKIFVISGTVTDSITGNQLVGANVYLEGTGFGTSTDQRGKYKLVNINEGEYKISVSYIGHLKVEQKYMRSITELLLT